MFRIDSILTLLSRPPDGCRGLAGEDQYQGWRLRHRVSDAPFKRALDRDLLDERIPGAENARSYHAVAVIGGRLYGLRHRLASASQLTACGAAPQGFRPAGRGRPPPHNSQRVAHRSPLWAVVALDRRVTHFLR